MGTCQNKIFYLNHFITKRFRVTRRKVQLVMNYTTDVDEEEGYMVNPEDPSSNGR